MATFHTNQPTPTKQPKEKEKNEETLAVENARIMIRHIMRWGASCMITFALI